MQPPTSWTSPGEQHFGLRFDGARAYLVTFRLVDLLYEMDFSSPADPRLAGVLEVPGFSDPLSPLGDGLQLGVGRDAVRSLTQKQTLAATARINACDL